ncbi:uroporphyrinogen decarboxylase family protein [Actinomyces procaprae]|uniref:uroporphyrinogen decarboxylase family protein n=1 Tax=Actinomyces procaprae TaxID=2560010 RepID=UPI001F027BD9|nr:uroporphyrinogen decarboxylase family protein [Actinomyces procaprae]
MSISAQNSDGADRPGAGPGTAGNGAARPQRPALLEALAGRRPARTPVWFMRQAGRSLPEYRALRERAGAPMLDVCLWPESTAQVTLQPVRRHGVDAAVLFSDIMVPLRLAGVEVRIEPGTGPVLDAPVRDHADVRRLTAHRYGQAERAGTGPDGDLIDGAAGVEAIQAAARAVVAELGSPRRPGAGIGPDPPGCPPGRGRAWHSRAARPTGPRCSDSVAHRSHWRPTSPRAAPPGITWPPARSCTQTRPPGTS